jgi:hypothetical protein
MRRLLTNCVNHDVVMPNVREWNMQLVMGLSRVQIVVTEKLTLLQ